MGLDLEWELHAFKGLMALWRKLKPTPKPLFDATRVVHLVDVERRLQIVAQMVAEAPVKIMVGRGAGGVRGLDILLPADIDVLPSPSHNEALYVLRAAFAGAVVRVLGRLPPGRRIPADDVDRAILTLDVARDARALLADELAGAEAALAEVWGLTWGTPSPTMAGTRAERLQEWQRATGRPWHDVDAVAALRRLPGDVSACQPLLLMGELVPVLSETAPPIDGTSPADELKQATAPTTTKEAPPITEVRRTVLDPKEQKKSALMHTFEKVETVDTFQGQARDGDGSDELTLHEEALKEVDFKDMIRGGEDAGAMLHADLTIDADIPDVGTVRPGETGVLYDEWDHRRRAYRPGWCTVYPTPFTARVPGPGREAARVHRRVIASLHDELARLRHERRPMNRQHDGPDIDIDAFIDELTAARAGHSGNGRLYARRERHRLSLSTTILLDMSMSSDSWVLGRRVLDVARDVTVVLGEVASKLHESMEVLAFASETRNHCRVYEVCRRDEPWSIGRDRLGALRPQGYTRIGPALRHAIARAAKAPTVRKLVILVSDGKPTDYDRYEGRYGVDDIRQALREGEQLGIVCHALAIDSQARTHLPEMFGPGAWHVLSDPARLDEVMRATWGRIAR